MMTRGMANFELAPVKAMLQQLGKEVANFVGARMSIGLKLQETKG